MILAVTPEIEWSSPLQNRRAVGGSPIGQDRDTLQPQQAESRRQDGTIEASLAWLQLGNNR